MTVEIPSKAMLESHIRKSFMEMKQYAHEEFDIAGSAYPINLEISYKAYPNSHGICRQRGQSKQKARGIYVKINAFNLVNYPVKGIVEYPIYEMNPSIGSFQTEDWRIWVDCILAHEMAHAVQFSMGSMRDHPLRDNTSVLLRFNGFGTWENGHGSFFRKIYKNFRTKFVNHRIADMRFPHDRKSFGGDYTDNRKDTIIAKRQASRLTDHKDIGAKVKLPGCPLATVIEYHTRAKKFKYIVKLVGSDKRYKISVAQFNGWRV